MKKLLTLTVALLLLALCGVCAFAAKDAPVVVDHVVYRLIAENDNMPQHYEVTDFFDSEDAMQGVKKLMIPDQIKGVPVMTIRTAGYAPKISYVKTEVEEIVLPDTITRIGEYAFANMTHLSTLALPSSVTYLGRDAFLKCTALESIAIPASVGMIGEAAFAKCTSLQYIDLPASLESIGARAFYRAGLRLLRVPGGCTLESRALMDARKLKKVVFEPRTSDALPLQGSYTFSNCERLLKVYLPKQAPKYALSYTFTGCGRLKAVYRTDSIGTIWNSAFDGCDALTSFTVPAGAEKVNYNAFAGCAGLKKLRVLTTNAAVFVNHTEHGNCLQNLPAGCKVYVRTDAMKAAVVNAGCGNRVIVKADLK